MPTRLQATWTSQFIGFKAEILLAGLGKAANPDAGAPPGAGADPGPRLDAAPGLMPAASSAGPKTGFPDVVLTAPPATTPAAAPTAGFPDVVLTAPPATAPSAATPSPAAPPAPATGATPTPANGSAPAPANETTPAPANGATPAPPNGTTPAPANAPSPATGDHFVIVVNNHTKTDFVLAGAPKLTGGKLRKSPPDKLAAGTTVQADFLPDPGGSQASGGTMEWKTDPDGKAVWDLTWTIQPNSDASADAVAAPPESGFKSETKTIPVDDGAGLIYTLSGGKAPDQPAAAPGPANGATPAPDQPAATPAQGNGAAPAPANGTAPAPDQPAAAPGPANGTTPAPDQPATTPGPANGTAPAQPDQPDDDFAPPPKSKQPTLRIKDESPDGWVEYAQRLLNKWAVTLKEPIKGVQKDPVTGAFDQKMHDKVIAFQKNVGCKAVDGVIGNETWSMLREGKHEAVGTDGRKPHGFEQKDAQGRFATEKTGEAGYEAGDDHYYMFVVSTGEQPIDDFHATVKISQPDGTSHTHKVKIGPVTNPSGDGQGDFHTVLIPDFRRTFKIDKDKQGKPVDPLTCTVDAYLDKEIGGDRFTGPVTVPNQPGQ